MKLYHEIKNKEPFRYVYWCFDCGRSDKGIELHHIRGRKNIKNIYLPLSMQYLYVKFAIIK